MNTRRSRNLSTKRRRPIQGGYDAEHLADAGVAVDGVKIGFVFVHVGVNQPPFLSVDGIDVPAAPGIHREGCPCRRAASLAQHRQQMGARI
jgi:hypothetical protein